jgi:hypothetical protein
VVLAARCTSRELQEALRTTAGLGQQGPHISQVSSKLASLNPPKYTKRIVTTESKEINIVSILFKMKTNGLDENFEIKAES